MPDCLDEGTLLGVSRDDHSGLSQRLPPVQGQVPLFLIDTVVTLVASLRQNGANFLLEKFCLFRRQFFGLHQRESGALGQEH